MRSLIMVVISIAIFRSPAVAAQFNLLPVADTSIYRERPGNSNGTGSIFAGNAANQSEETRRGLIRFDLSALPTGSLVQDASLQLFVEQTTASAHSMGLHRLQESWGESTSNGTGAGAPAAVNDATWVNRFVAPALNASTPWTTQGGTFVTAASATTIVDGIGSRPLWAGAGMVSDVSRWLATPAENYGWILLGNETQPRTAKRFSSRDAISVIDRPTLLLDLRIGGDTNDDDHVDFDDLLTLAQNYNVATTIGFDAGDFNGDAVVNFDDLLVLAQNYGFNSVQTRSAVWMDWQMARAVVPEPVAVLSVACGLLWCKRSRIDTPART